MRDRWRGSIGVTRNGPGVRRWRFDCDMLTRVARLRLVLLEIDPTHL